MSLRLRRLQSVLITGGGWWGRVRWIGKRPPWWRALVRRAGSQLNRGRCELMITELSSAAWCSAVRWLRDDRRPLSLLIRNATLTTVGIQRVPELIASPPYCCGSHRHYLIQLRCYTQGCSLGLERLGLEAVSRLFWNVSSRLGLESLEKSNVSVSVS